MATAEPLTPRWIAEYRARVAPELTSIQRLAAEHIWTWFADLWELEQVDPNRLRALMAEFLPLLERIEESPASRDAAIVEAVEFLRAVDHETVRRRM